jgi:exopolysaccharide production protein ExoQ
MNLTVQLASLCLLVWCVDRIHKSWVDLPLVLRVLACLTLLLPLVQLIPVPPAVWQALPGAHLALVSRELAGTADQWFPLTLDPERTLMAFAALVPALVVLLLFEARSGAVRMALRFVITLGLVNFFVGTLQVISGDNAMLPYPIIEQGRLYGLFASHNTSGLFFVIALCALFGVDGYGPTALRGKWTTFAVGAILVLGTILTQSRSSTALLLVPLGAFALRWIIAQRKHPTPISWKYVAPIVLVIAGIGTLALTNERFQANFVRFEDLDDMRPLIWQDARVAWSTFFPMGSGMGSFDEIFQNFESLEHVTRDFARRAHNDYLELGIEAGAFGYAVLLGWLAWGAMAWFRARAAQRFSEVDGAALGLLVIAAQSVLDYPLRNQALLCLAALLIAVLAARSSNQRDRVVE